MSNEGSERERSAVLRPLSCARCDKRLECCCFCDRSDCPEAVCYPCVAVDLRQSTAALHAHGG